MTRVVFFGTPDEAVPALDSLHRALGVDLVVTQPDRPKGRSGQPTPPPVGVRAGELGIEVAQPASRGELAAVTAGNDLGVVVAYGRILRPEVLESFAHGILNIHFSLLPRWRGAAPVARALMAGDTMTGVTIIRLDHGLDTGPVLTAQAVDIGSEENAGELTLRLAHLGARLLVSAIPAYLSGDVTPVSQTDEGLTYADKVSQDDRPLDADTDPSVFIGRVRGLAPSPGATMVIDGSTHKVLAAKLYGTPPLADRWETQESMPVVAVGDQGVALMSLQSPGRRPQSGEDWVRGRQAAGGTVRLRA